MDIAEIDATDQPCPDDAPGNVRPGDHARHVETGHLATIAHVWDYCGDTCVTVHYDGRPHLDNGGAITWWQRPSAHGPGVLQAAIEVTR